VIFPQQRLPAASNNWAWALRGFLSRLFVPVTAALAAVRPVLMDLQDRRCFSCRHRTRLV
jgi:hypothetical protein